MKVMLVHTSHQLEIIQLNEAAIKQELGELVRDSVERGIINVF